MEERCFLRAAFLVVLKDLMYHSNIQHYENGKYYFLCFRGKFAAVTNAIEHSVRNHYGKELAEEQWIILQDAVLWLQDNTMVIVERFYNDPNRMLSGDSIEFQLNGRWIPGTYLKDEEGATGATGRVFIQTRG